MKTMQGISPPGPPRLWAGVALAMSTLAMMLIPVSAHAAPAPAPPAPPVRALREARGGGDPLARGYNNRWGYGPGPMAGRGIGFGGRGAPRWLVGLLILLAAALAAGLAWSLLKSRAGGATGGGAQQILERRLAEGAIDVEDFEQRRDALRRTSREPS
jgi:uncharacterized membrane protein